MYQVGTEVTVTRYKRSEWLRMETLHSCWNSKVLSKQGGLKKNDNPPWLGKKVPKFVEVEVIEGRGRDEEGVALSGEADIMYRVVIRETDNKDVEQ